ncbi:MAG: fibrobacter succinogenes major paralogous domain-containing protein [Mariniphaga sp.]
MNNNKLIVGLVLIALVAFAINGCKPITEDRKLITFNPTLGYGRMTDQENNTYKTIKIGSQTWMAENLRATKYRNGDPISNVTNNTNWAALTTGAYCWNNDIAAYKAIYGVLYNWHAVADGRNIAPVGWHVPTDAEWTTLIDSLGGQSVAMSKLKEVGTGNWESQYNGTTNESGFTALPGGSYIDDFEGIGKSGNWWSSSANGGSNAWYLNISTSSPNANRSPGSKQSGFSVRCVMGNPVAPTISSTVASATTSTSATSGGKITNDGGSTVTARGVCWSTDQNPTTANSKTIDGAGVGTFTSNLIGLLPGTTYYVKAYATNSMGTTYGNQMTLSITAVMATLTTTAATAITAAAATSGGDITTDGGSAVTARGVCWATSENPTTSNSKTNDGTGAGTFTSNLTGLLPGKTYYVKAYATNSIGTAYGNQVTLTTTAVMATLTTTAATAITSASATCGGDITTDGGSVVTSRGICWSIGQNPTTANSKTIDGTGAGSFTSNLIGLLPGTTYYVKAYATNSVGTTYGNQVTLITPAVMATLSTTAASAVATTTATSGGTITTDGGVTVTARGVCWSITQNPTTSNSKTSDGTGTGTFTSSLIGLLPGTTYYVKAYATNSIGTSYGNQEILTTTAVMATLSTTAATAVATTNATSGGNITTDGGSVVTARGVCWSIGQNPTISNSKTVDGTGTGSFSSTLTGLLPGTTYYVKAYATNSIGTTYGNEITLKTTAPSQGTVTDIDGNVYHYITIGTQTWMVENLKTTHYRNGDPIPNVTENTVWAGLGTGAYCWYNNDAATYKAGYGAIYNWYAVVDDRNIAPFGWHVPTNAEWITLTDYLGGVSEAGGKLKEAGTAHWLSPNTGATNASGFTGLPGGYRNINGSFDWIGKYGFWWSYSEYLSKDAWSRSVYCSDSNVYRGFDNYYGLSVRCLRD